MNLGIISDIHADPETLQSTLTLIGAMNVEKIVCAGDLVGYGPDANQVVDLMLNQSIPSVRGNHDRWTIKNGPHAIGYAGGGKSSQQTIEYLCTLPFSFLVSIGDRKGMVFHGSPKSDMDFVNDKDYSQSVFDKWFDRFNVDFIILGHTHEPMIIKTQSNNLIINPGSVASKNVISSQTFAILNSKTMTVTFHNVFTGDQIKFE